MKVVPEKLLTPEDPLTLRGWRENYAVTAEKLDELGFLRTHTIYRLEKAGAHFEDLGAGDQNKLIEIGERLESDYLR